MRFVEQLRFVEQSNSEKVKWQLQEAKREGENGKQVFNGYRVSAREDEKVLEMDGGYECKPCEYI